MSQPEKIPQKPTPAPDSKFTALTLLWSQMLAQYRPGCGRAPGPAV